MAVPSGAQVEITRGEQSATVVEVGAGLRRYRLQGRDLLDGYALQEMAPAGAGQVLMPWPNRIRDGVYEFGGVRQQLPINEPERSSAIHGLTRWSNWVLAERETHRALFTLTLHPQPGYPFTLQASVEYALSETGLEVTTEATNGGEDPLPFGLGFHPYLQLAPSVDGLTLQLAARSYLLADDRGIPSGERRPTAGGPFDFSRAREIQELKLDTCFADLPAGGVVATVAGPEGGVELSVDPAFAYLMVFTGDTLAPPRRRRGLAVEPMTCPPNAFQSIENLTVLEPGRSMSAAWSLRPV